MNSGIYSLTNTTNGKRYIGRSANLKKRKHHHFSCMKYGCHFNKDIQSDYDSGDKFEFEILEECDPKDLCEREIFWIAEYHSFGDGYNRCAGGASTLGYVCTEEAKRKISEKNSGRKFDQETIQRRVNSLHRHMEEDPEFAERIRSRSRELGKISGGWNRGRHHSDESKKKLSEALKGRYISPEHKEKLREMYSGEKSLSAKLKTSDVVNIRYRFLCGERQIDILKDYPQITPQTIYDIVRNRRWHSVPNDKESLEKMMEAIYGKTS